METEFNPQPEYSNTEEMYWVPASNGLRFANFMIDSIVFIIATIVLLFTFGFVCIMMGHEIPQYLVADDLGSKLLKNLTSSIIFILLYTVLEASSGGYTVGKLITGTKVIREDGGKVSLGDALKRSLIRYVPFDALSIFFSERMWHDKWSKTMVIKK